MSQDYTRMDDPTFLALRTSVREQIEALQETYAELTAEFDRRARAAWSKAS